MIKGIAKDFIDVCPIMDDSFLKYGCVFTRPIPAVSINAIPTCLRIKNKRIKFITTNDDPSFVLKHQCFIIVPKEHYDSYHVVQF